MTFDTFKHKTKMTIYSLQSKMYNANIKYKSIMEHICYLCYLLSYVWFFMMLASIIKGYYLSDYFNETDISQMSATPLVWLFGIFGVFGFIRKVSGHLDEFSEANDRMFGVGAFLQIIFILSFFMCIMGALSTTIYAFAYTSDTQRTVDTLNFINYFIPTDIAAMFAVAGVGSFAVYYPEGLLNARAGIIVKILLFLVSILFIYIVSVLIIFDTSKEYALAIFGGGLDELSRNSREIWTYLIHKKHISDLIWTKWNVR